jgi:hypothetical protein
MWNSIPDTIPNDIVGAWIYKLQCTTDVSELTNNIKVWPNPVSGVINVTTPSNSGNIKVMSIDGRCVYQNKYTSSLVRIDSSELDQGTYVIVINDSTGKLYTTNIVK